MTTYNSIPRHLRTVNDLVPRPPENFHRGEIDRTIIEADTIFSVFGNEHAEPGLASLHHEFGPIEVATEVARTSGRLAIAGVGCGTGNEAVTWGRVAAKKAGIGIGRVSMTGVSRQDYRGESRFGITDDYTSGRRPRVRYIVGDAADMSMIDSQSQDVTLAYNSMVYADDPIAWLNEMIRITRQGGKIFFNTTIDQVKEGEPFAETLSKLREDEWPLMVGYVMTGPTNTESSGSLRLPGSSQPAMTASAFRLEVPMA